MDQVICALNSSAAQTMMVGGNLSNGGRVKLRESMYVNMQLCTAGGSSGRRVGFWKKNKAGDLQPTAVTLKQRAYFKQQRARDSPEC
jgi:hypothetical protein